eukprot:984867-Pyramimonas_sp.AAC.1
MRALATRRSGPAEWGARRAEMDMPRLAANDQKADHLDNAPRPPRDVDPGPALETLVEAGG